ncbi:methyltransferase domain protein [Anopheles sinensis]|uniref:Methyltransferase domain protein n=1 Tax=Anopheles sinensis TaxID=74873 RepID=A0A084WKA9_ANOSI|nr:methyltransferase domain protein [Anopheles sinensis]
MTVDVGQNESELGALRTSVVMLRHERAPSSKTLSSERTVCDYGPFPETKPLSPKGLHSRSEAIFHYPQTTFIASGERDVYVLKLEKIKLSPTEDGE